MKVNVIFVFRTINYQTTRDSFLYNRYLYLCLINNLNHNKIVSDTVDVENHSSLARKYIHENVLSQSNYYKNLIVKVQELSNTI